MDGGATLSSMRCAILIGVLLGRMHRVSDVVRDDLRQRNLVVFAASERKNANATAVKDDESLLAILIQRFPEDLEQRLVVRV